MSRKLLGVCGFLVFGTFGMLSGVAQAHHDEPAASTETTSLQGDGLQRQEMSDEERERREAVCDRGWVACCDGCNRSRTTRVDLAMCKRDCGDKLGECMKDIGN